MEANKLEKSENFLKPLIGAQIQPICLANNYFFERDRATDEVCVLASYEPVSPTEFMLLYKKVVLKHYKNCTMSKSFDDCADYMSLPFDTSFAEV